MIERQIDRALYVGHHAKALLPNYTASDFYVRDWEPLLIPKTYATAGSGPGAAAGSSWKGKVVRAHDDDLLPSSKAGEAQDVLLVRRRRPTRLAKDNCHLLFFHGNAQNLAMTLDTLDAFEEKLGCHVYAIEYTGYRNDQHQSIAPSEEELTEDALAATKWLLDVTRRGDQVFLYGHSLGAALAIDVAAKMHEEETERRSESSSSSRNLERRRRRRREEDHQAQDATAGRYQQSDPAELAGIVLESPFLSAIRTRMDYESSDAFGETLSGSSSIPSLSRNFLKPLDKFKNEEKIDLIDPDLPIFIGHATNDEIVPYDHGQKLFDLIEGERKVGLFLESDSHALHNETEPASVPFYAALNNFLKKTLQENTAAAESPKVRANSGRNLYREPFSWESHRDEEDVGFGRREGKSPWDNFLLGLTGADSSRQQNPIHTKRQTRRGNTNTIIQTNVPAGGNVFEGQEDDHSFGFISVRKAPQVRYDAQANTQTTDIIIDLTAEMRARGHQILTLQSSQTKMLPKMTNAARRYSPQIYQDKSDMELVNHYKGCTFNTHIGPSVTALGTFDLDENARASITLPAKICDADSPRSGLFQTVEDPLYTECREFSYQFLDQADCEVSTSLHAADAL